jgi:hypothetical protein
MRSASRPAPGRADRISRDRARALRREVLLMRAFQSRVTGPVLRRIAKPQNILDWGWRSGRHGSS